MFKKTLAAAALLGAFAGSAVAADVTLYGVVDYGLQYTHVDSDKAGTDAVDNFQLSSGNQSGARFGLKGSEDLGNGVKAGFHLETGSLPIPVRSLRTAASSAVKPVSS